MVILLIIIVPLLIWWLCRIYKEIENTIIQKEYGSIKHKIYSQEFAKPLALDKIKIIDNGNLLEYRFNQDTEDVLTISCNNPHKDKYVIQKEEDILTVSFYYRLEIRERYINTYLLTYTFKSPYGGVVEQDGALLISPEPCKSILKLHYSRAYFDTYKAEQEEKHLKLMEVKEKIERELVATKLQEKQRKRQLEKSVLRELIDSGELFAEAKRPPIPKEICDVVFSRDAGKCVYCGSTDNLQFDHIIPFSRGGATSVENLQILCQKCNIEKSNKIG